MHQRIGLTALALLGLSTFASSSCQSAPVRRARLSEHALWVTRWDYKTAADCRKIAENCSSIGIDTVLFQVRGNATAFYRSSFEPWAEQFDFKDPGFDPLATMIDEAHARGLRLVAWVNVVPAWYGLTPPKDANQVCNKHPDWLWYDQKGKRQAPSEKFYVSLNPCLAEVRAYLADVIGEIAARYPVDGVHLDYMRFPNENPAIPTGSGIDYPRDAKTLALFAKATGKTPETDAAAWDRWRTEQVTELVRQIRARVNALKPGLELSSAVGARRENALTHFQDANAWLAQDLVDAVYPMNYTGDANAFSQRCDAWIRSAPGERVVMGIMFEKGDAATLRTEVQRALDQFQGFSIFAYSSLFPSPNDAVDRPEAADRVKRDALLKAVLPWLREVRPASAPPRR